MVVNHDNWDNQVRNTIFYLDYNISGATNHYKRSDLNKMNLEDVPKIAFKLEIVKIYISFSQVQKTSILETQEINRTKYVESLTLHSEHHEGDSYISKIYTRQKE